MKFTSILDFIFLMYFVVHIPVAIFIDSQAIFPKWIYPGVVVDLMDWYCREFKDPMMVESPAWFKSFICCEVLFQLPFFFVAVYAFLKGVNRCPWIQRPMLIYAAHTATTTICITFHLFLNDFSTSKYPGPTSVNERLKLFAIYSPFLLIPLVLLVNFAFRKFPKEKLKQR
ncbi:Sigma intracellular receptor 2 [Mytilus coruscus]|uniref:Sigma intracellular receptor 2 n=1 Tax=Mytilus coruscus TaxID=42192 RepID=A0A6J7ZZS4_MYTCO|nr:Sigma intracellular receptor 2 [Mytilus coruscus]